MKTSKELGIKPHQRRNIAKLCIYVNDFVNATSFDIRWFFQTPFEHERDMAGDTASSKCRLPEDYKCGSAACFLGFGPLAGIVTHGDVSWSAYAQYMFGAPIDTAYNKSSSLIYEMLFSHHHKNCKKAAVLRGCWLLECGFPTIDPVELSYWEAPKGYQPNWKAIKKLSQRKF